MFFIIFPSADIRILFRPKNKSTLSFSNKSLIRKNFSLASVFRIIKVFNSIGILFALLDFPNIGWANKTIIFASCKLSIFPKASKNQVIIRIKRAALPMYLAIWKLAPICLFIFKVNRTFPVRKSISNTSIIPKLKWHIQEPVSSVLLVKRRDAGRYQDLFFPTTTSRWWAKPFLQYVWEIFKVLFAHMPFPFELCCQAFYKLSVIVSASTSH